MSSKTKAIPILFFDPIVARICCYVRKEFYDVFPSKLSYLSILEAAYSRELYPNGCWRVIFLPASGIFATEFSSMMKGLASDSLRVKSIASQLRNKAMAWSNDHFSNQPFNAAFAAPLNSSKL